MTAANVPYSLLHTLRACLDGTADQPAWDAAKDELDELLLAEPMSPAETTACSLCEAGHVPLTPCDGLLTDAERELLRPAPSILDASGPVSFEWHCVDLGPRPSVQQDADAITYPITLFNDRAGVWVEWENDWHGRIVAPPEDAAIPSRRKRSSGADIESSHP